MKADIIRLDPREAYDLIYLAHLSTLPELDQETMHRAIMNSSRIWCGSVDHKILALWGLIPPTLLSDTAYLWLFTTPRLSEHVFLFVRHSQRVIQTMLAEYPHIVGHAKVGNHKAIQWLRWLGAEFGEPINNDFLPFTIRASQKWPQDSVQSA